MVALHCFDQWSMTVAQVGVGTSHEGNTEGCWLKVDAEVEDATELHEGEWWN